MIREQIVSKFSLFFADTGGFDSWLTANAPPLLFDRLAKLETNPLSLAQFNQFLLLTHEAGATAGFFAYYWFSEPEHVYDVTKVPGYDSAWTRAHAIQSLEHLYWGLYRFCTDALLFFGNTRTAYRELRKLSSDELNALYASKRFDTAFLQNRGPSLTLESIPKDARYLISEMACKSYGIGNQPVSELKRVLLEAFNIFRDQGGKRATVRQLLDGKYVADNYSHEKQELLFSSDELMDAEITVEEDLDRKYSEIAVKFTEARKKALSNTKLYLSMVDQLDVYVATSMRTRNDFRNMADLCDRIFADQRLRRLNIRYFDPTLSAAEGHMDKGLIECLMVKCAKALVYCAGDKESFGKDAEAAMALSQGKPVIFLCDETQKERFYRDVHPLSRLIDFHTGVPVGAMVTSTPEHASELLCRIFENKMEYNLEQPTRGLLQLKDRLTNSIVRFQTNDKLLRETFWNYYHNK
ncbi:MAG: hypothetical protein HYU64_03910 [Armatimonadetes bacterium]|nr:hypothetical protein [Armatimonadota bacterium]